MLTRSQVLSYVLNSNWSSLEYEQPLLSYTIRCGVDIGFVEGIVNGTYGSWNSNLINQASSQAQIIAGGFAEDIPIIGEILAVLTLIGGFSLGSFTAQYDSATAQDRLREWTDYMRNYWKSTASWENKIVPPLVTIDHYIFNVNWLIDLRPKCLSPTTNCEEEHTRYIARTSYMKESQSSILQMIREYFWSDEAYQQYLIDFSLSDNNVSGDNKKVSGIGAGLLAGALFFITK